ncbi:MAG: MFS transporter [Nanoarchaeota archaeon]|nr:MFS transporter [Nanoarchaeota archaeon]
MDKKPLWTIFLLVFLDLVGLGIVIPVLPLILLQPEFSFLSQGLQNVLIGLLVAAYPIAQFFGAPVLGKYSDRHGRKPILLISIAGTVLGYLLFGLGILKANLLLLFLGRLLDGFTGGNISVALSSISDISKGQEKTKHFGMVGMAFGLGFILGPFIGGKLADPSVLPWFTHATPFWFAAILSALNLLFILFAFKETLKERYHKKITFFDGFHDIKKAFGMAELRVIFIVFFLMSFGWSFFTQFFPLYLYKRFSFSPSDIGNLFGVIGLTIAFTQGGVVRFLASRVRPAAVLRVVLLAAPVLLILLTFQKSVAGLYLINILLPLFFGTVFPNITTLISDAVGPESQGEVQGMRQSLQSLSQAIPPLIATFALSLSVSAPIYIGASTLLLSWLTFILFYKHRKKEQF